MAKKQLNVKQMQTKYRALQYTTFIGEFISIFTPFIILGCINAKEWFYNEEGWKVGLGGTLALALMGIAVFLVTKKKEDNKITGGYITLVVGWFAVTFVFMLLADIMNQISTIMLFGGFGIMGAFGLDMTSKSFKLKADSYKEAIGDAKKKIIKEQAEKEIRDKEIVF